jgi:isochorismate hydrolase
MVQGVPFKTTYPKIDSNFRFRRAILKILELQKAFISLHQENTPFARGDHFFE